MKLTNLKLIASVVVLFSLGTLFVSCGDKKKKEAEAPAPEVIVEGEGENAVSYTISNSTEANPAADFIYETVKGGEGILIQKYIGSRSDVIIPATIENLPVVKIQYNAFLGNKSIYSVVVPASVKEIEYNAFRESSIKKVTLPEGLETIGSGCFRESGLTEIEIPSTASFAGGYQFYLCDKLTSVKIPSTLAVIPEGCFQNTGLTSVDFPEGVTTVSANAFYYSNVTSFNIPASMTKILASAFSGCPISNVVIAERSEAMVLSASAFYNCNTYGTMTVALRQSLNALGYKGVYFEKDITGCR